MCKSDTKENPVTSSSSLPSVNTVEHELKYRNTKIDDWSKEIDQSQFIVAEPAALEPTVSSSPVGINPTVSSSSAVSQQQQSRGQSFRNSRGSDRGYPRGAGRGYPRGGGRGWSRNARGPITPVAQPDPGKTVRLLTKDGRDPKVTILPASSNDVRFDPHYRSTYNQSIPRNVSNVQKSNTDVQNVQSTDGQRIQAADVQKVPETDGQKVQSIDNLKDQKAVKENDQRRHDFPKDRRSKGNGRSPRSNFNNHRRLTPPHLSGLRPPAAPLQRHRTFVHGNNSRRNDGNQSIPRTKSEHAFTKSNTSQNLSQTTTQGQEVKPAVPKPNVFGKAKPVDTHVKLMEIEQKKLKEKEERNKKRNGMNDSSKKVSPDTTGVTDPDKVDKGVGDQPSKTCADAATPSNVLSVDVPSTVNLSEIPSFQPKSNFTASTPKTFKNRHPKHFNQSYTRMMPVPQYYQTIPHQFQPFGIQAPAQYFGQLEQPQFPPMPQMIYQPHQIPQQHPSYHAAYPQVPYQQGATAASQQYVPQVHPQYAQQHMQQLYNNGQPVYYVTPPYNPNGTSNYGQPQ